MGHPADHPRRADGPRERRRQRERPAEQLLRARLAGRPERVEHRRRHDHGHERARRLADVLRLRLVRGDACLDGRQRRHRRGARRAAEPRDEAREPTTSTDPRGSSSPTGTGSGTTSPRRRSTRACTGGNRVNEVQDYGVEVGGPIIKDRMWLWGAYGRNQVNLFNVNGDPGQHHPQGRQRQDEHPALRLDGSGGHVHGRQQDQGRARRQPAASSAGLLEPGRPVSRLEGGALADLLVQPVLHRRRTPTSPTSSRCSRRAARTTTRSSSIRTASSRAAISRTRRSVPRSRSTRTARSSSRPGTMGHELKYGFTYRNTAVDSTLVLAGRRQLRRPGGLRRAGRGADPPGGDERRPQVLQRLPLRHADAGQPDDQRRRALRQPEAATSTASRSRATRSSGTCSRRSTSTGPRRPSRGTTSFPASASPTRWERTRRRCCARAIRSTRISSAAARSPSRTPAPCRPSSSRGTTRTAITSSSRNEVDLSRLLYFYGLDPAHPTSTVSPNVIDPNLKAGKTHEIVGGIEREIVPEFVVGLSRTPGASTREPSIRTARA